MLFSRKNISPERVHLLNAFCRRAAVKFNNLNLLDLALHHRSFSNESPEFRHANNERLEFLGDSVLGMVTAAFLYNDMKENPEGDLSRIKSAVVSEETLAPIARALGIDGLLVLGKGEEQTGGRQKRAILADAMEAVIGAYYLDSGYGAAQKFVQALIVPEVRKVQDNRGHKDYKTLLQEFCQKKYRTCPSYELVRKAGPEHDKTFWVTVHLPGISYGPEQGKSKKEAEQNAAEKAWAEIGGT